MHKDTSRETRDFEIRRIFLPGEAREIRALQRNAPEFYRHYPKHDQWLDMAIEQVIDGVRVAFGVYKLAFDPRRRPTVQLVGSIILKKKLFANIIEVKNLLIRPDCRSMGYGTALYEEVEEYCAKSGYSVIQTEVPCSEINTVGFLHKMGQRVVEMKKSPYKAGEYVYEMEKTLFPFYGGDCFDLYEIALWLIRNYYAFSNIRERREENYIEFELETKASVARVCEDRLAVKGLAIVDDSTSAQIQDAFSAGDNTEYSLLLAFGVSFGEHAQKRAASQRVMLIDQQTIYKTFRHLFAYKPPTFPKSEIAGMIVAMNPEYFNRIADSQTSFTYFKGGPVGKYLKEGDKLLVLSEPTPRQPVGGIKGFGDVVEVISGLPQDMWNRLQNNSPLFSRDEYDVFTRNKSDVLGVVLRNFKRTSTVDYSRLEDSVIGKGADLMDLGHYYISHQMFTCFLDLINGT